jgi:hypothetical protein
VFARSVYNRRQARLTRRLQRRRRLGAAARDELNARVVVILLIAPKHGRTPPSLPDEPPTRGFPQGGRRRPRQCVLPTDENGRRVGERKRPVRVRSKCSQDWRHSHLGPRHSSPAAAFPLQTQVACSGTLSATVRNSSPALNTRCTSGCKRKLTLFSTETQARRPSIRVGASAVNIAALAPFRRWPHHSRNCAEQSFRGAARRVDSCRNRCSQASPRFEAFGRSGRRGRRRG